MKHIYSLLAAVCLSSTASFAEYKEGYYDAMDGLVKEDLKAAAKSCVSAHKKLNYSDLPNYWKISDVYPEMYPDADGQDCLRFWDMYSDNIYLILGNQTGKQAFSANSMQREHSVPKSWWKKDGNVEYTPAYSDMWNLYPSDGPANNAKSNYPFGEVLSAKFNNGVTKVGLAKAGFGGGSATVFEPADEYKGDFARSLFYMATVYDELPWVVDNYNTMFRTESWPTLTAWAVDMLLDWARKDPVSEKEINRNDKVEECQSNRNPFVDFPDLFEFVWGDRQEDIFYIASNSVDGINAEKENIYEYSDGCIRILVDSRKPLVVTDIAGRIVMRIMNPRKGDIYTLSGSGLMLITSGSQTRKVMSR